MCDDPMGDDAMGGLTRRQVLAVLGAVAAGLATGVGAAPSPEADASKTPARARDSSRMPVIFLPHGGGPWPFVQPPMFDPRDEESLAAYLRSIAQVGVAPPRAQVVVSAHWEEPVPTVMSGARPGMLYDYYGFPPESYAVTWPAPGDPVLARRVRELLGRAGIASGEDAARGFDHGTFVPMKLAQPAADVPTVQLSLKEGLDPATHLAIGRALRPLRDEGVLIVGSGMTYHDLRHFGPDGRAASEAFDAWLREAATADPAARDRRLAAWDSAPSARLAHPREEHLLPLMVIAGAAGDDVGRVAYNDLFAGVRLSAFHFG